MGVASDSDRAGVVGGTDGGVYMVADEGQVADAGAGAVQESHVFTGGDGGVYIVPQRVVDMVRRLSDQFGQKRFNLGGGLLIATGLFMVTR
jgi:hypothetical protein